MRLLLSGSEVFLPLTDRGRRLQSGWKGNLLGESHRHDQMVSWESAPPAAAARSSYTCLSVRCLSPDPDQRPDICAVTSRISDIMMRMMDGLYASQNALQRRADRDRKRAQKYFLERHNSRMSCCQSKQVGSAWSCCIKFLQIFFFWIVEYLQENLLMDSDSLDQSSCAAGSLKDGEDLMLFITML